MTIIIALGYTLITLVVFTVMNNMIYDNKRKYPNDPRLRDYNMGSPMGDGIAVAIVMTLTLAFAPEVAFMSYLGAMIYTISKYLALAIRDGN